MNRNREQHRSLAISSFIRLYIMCAFLLALAAPAIGQSPSEQLPNPTKTTASSQPQPEMVSRESTPTFKVRVNQVLVRAVVRDKKGNLVRGLRQQDFSLFDRGKLQRIVSFSADELQKQGTETVANAGQKAGAQAATRPVAPAHYVAYLFDDLHAGFSSLAEIRQAADRHFKSLPATDRAAIFTTSGVGNLDFTDDRTKLHEALYAIRARVGTMDRTSNLGISHYLANLIENNNDREVLNVAIADTIRNGYAIKPDGAEAIVRSSARNALVYGEAQARTSIAVLDDVVRRVSKLPGQRTVVLASPGFLYEEHYSDLVSVLDRAIRANIPINTLNIGGLYTDPQFDATGRGSGLARFAIEAIQAEGELLGLVADATGGTRFHNNNDMDEGFRRLATSPEYSYILGFSPRDLKPDGKFHSLKVAVNRPEKLTIVARRGYFARKENPDPAAAAREQIEEAVFSQEEQQEIPVNVHTQFFKTATDETRLAVLTRVALGHISFQKAADRNCNTLTVVAALFDRNGLFMQGSEKVIDFRLLDQTLERLRSGVTVKSEFAVKPGPYLVRVVVRDTNGQLLSARNDAIEIP